jgi:hypothetical protein
MAQKKAQVFWVCEVKGCWRRESTRWERKASFPLALWLLQTKPSNPLQATDAHRSPSVVTHTPPLSPSCSCSSNPVKRIAAPTHRPTSLPEIRHVGREKGGVGAGGRGGLVDGVPGHDREVDEETDTKSMQVSRRWREGSILSVVQNRCG